jgi:hypothetical protein
MNSNGSKATAIVVALAVVVALFFLFKGGDDDGDATTAETTAAEATTATKETKKSKPDEPEVPRITIENGQPVGGVADLTFDKGDDVRFVVDSDTADEVHVHGYDIGEDVAAGGKVEFDFPADIDGVFEVELESSATQIAELTVNP